MFFRHLPPGHRPPSTLFTGTACIAFAGGNVVLTYESNTGLSSS